MLHIYSVHELELYVFFSETLAHAHRTSHQVGGAEGST